MPGSKSVQKKGGKSRGGGVKTRGGHVGSGGRSTAGRSNGGFVGTSTEDSIAPPSNLQNRSTTDNRGKGIATASRDKGMSPSSHDKGKGVDGGGSSSPGETQTPGRKGGNSSHDSNVSTRPSPQSHGTTHSTGNESISRRTLPLQYQPSSTRDQPLPLLRRTNLILNVQPRQQLQVQHRVQEEEEDDGEDREEEEDEDEIEADDIEPEEQDGDVNNEDADYDLLLAEVMADPARQRLPLLSEQPHPVRDTIW